MTAHQPNLLAYSGVLRKATLNHVLSEKLSENLNLPVVSFFGIADQDFTDDRWVKSSLLPDVERRNGILDLHIKLPERIMINRIPKPSRKLIDSWRNKIKDWLHQKTYSIKKFCEDERIEFSVENIHQINNLDYLWETVEESYAQAENYSDFNAFTMSKIINEVWGYDTLFCRFSECQQIFEREFSFLLTHFAQYSRYVKETSQIGDNTAGRGTYEQEYQTIPFWYHCQCGSKARLLADSQEDSIIGQGQCLNCREEYKISLLSKGQPNISGILTGISARSLAMPLVFFSGLGVCCYVGGVGGLNYLRQAKYVADHMKISFPPVVVWRPKDTYLGLSQLEAILTFKRLSGTFDLSKYSESVAKLKARVCDIKNEINKLESQKTRLMKRAIIARGKVEEEIKNISTKQSRVRRQANFPILAHNLKLLENVDRVLSLHSSIVDYALNIGLKETSEQWIRFLNENGSLVSEIHLKTDLDQSFPHIRKELEHGRGNRARANKMWSGSNIFIRT
jgi:molecular chaperone GrpE (heat shock protein)